MKNVENLTQLLKEHHDLHRVVRFTSQGDPALEMAWCMDCNRELGRIYSEEWYPNEDRST